MFCTKCGNSVTEKNAFCAGCGQPVESTDSAPNASSQENTDDDAATAPVDPESNVTPSATHQEKTQDDAATAAAEPDSSVTPSATQALPPNDATEASAAPENSVAPSTQTMLERLKPGMQHFLAWAQASTKNKLYVVAGVLVVCALVWLQSQRSSRKRTQPNAQTQSGTQATSTKQVGSKAKTSANGRAGFGSTSPNEDSNTMRYLGSGRTQRLAEKDAQKYARRHCRKRGMKYKIVSKFFETGSHDVPICNVEFKCLKKSGGLRYSYVAMLSPLDHSNSNARRLKSAEAIIRQDRANYHKFNFRTPDDQGDPVLHSKKKRGEFYRLLKSSRLSKSLKRRIVNGQPLIRVSVYGDRVDVKIIGGR